MEPLTFSSPVLCMIKPLNRDQANKKSYDVIIVGAGVAGSALAYTLGKDGRHVHVIERNLNEPNRIVGELLQPGGYLKLIELGQEDCVKDIDAQKVLGYALYKGEKTIRLDYPLENYQSDVAGRSFHHGRFVQNMRMEAASLPKVKLEQGTGTSLLEEGGTIKGVEYKTSIGEELKAYAPLTIVCDGCFSSLRSSLCKPKVTKPSHFAGLILENCQLPYPRYAHVILGKPSFFIFYPISSSEIRVLIDLPGSKVPSISGGKMAQFLKTQVASQIPPELRNAFVSSVDKGQIRMMPSTCMPAVPNSIPRAFLLGDALNMRHPITGGGMTVALCDFVVLRDLFRHLKHFDDTSAVSQYLQLFYKIRKPGAFTINLMAGALHKVSFTSSDEAKEAFQQATFDYLRLSETLHKGSVGLLSGLNSRPWSLFLCCFPVAIYAVGRTLLPVPTPKRVLAAARLISGALAIIIPIIKDEGIQHAFFTTKVPTKLKKKRTFRRDLFDKEKRGSYYIIQDMRSKICA